MAPRSARVSGQWAESLAEAREAAREELEAAWQLHVERVERQLAAGWREHIRRVVDERFTDLIARLGAELEEAVGRERVAARRSLTGILNQAARRLRNAESRPQWASALVDAAVEFCGRSALLAVNGNRFAVEKASFAAWEEPPALKASLDAAPALASAAESLEPVVAIFSAGELSAALTERFASPAGQKAYLFPVGLGRAASAILYAEPGEDPVDASALELLAALAAAFWEARGSGRRPPASGPLVRIGEAAAALEPELHSRAQRFARVQVAEMRLYKSREVIDGRSHHDLYARLEADIGKAREEYRRQFLENSPSMVDYLHVELVRTLANDDASLLGEGYPGPMA